MVHMTQKERNLLLKEECLAFSDEAKLVMDAFKSADAETLKYLALFSQNRIIDKSHLDL